MTPKNLRNDRDAQVGIGTMIVFIATILVAAVAAGVLIDTSQKLQDKSTRTGNEAVNNVGTSLNVLGVWGDRGGTTTSDLVDDLYVDVALAAGATDVDLNDLVIHYNDGAKLVRFTAETGMDAEADNRFFIEVVRDDDGSLGTAPFDGILSTGDIVRIKFGQHEGTAPGDDLELDGGTDVDLNLALSTGSPVSVGFATPVNYGTTQILELF